MTFADVMIVIVFPLVGVGGLALMFYALYLIGRGGRRP